MHKIHTCAFIINMLCIGGSERVPADTAQGNLKFIIYLAHVCRYAAT